MNNNFSEQSCFIRKITTGKIKKTVTENGVPVLKINIEYPEICGSLSKSENVYNNFYRTLTENYAKYCEEKLSRRIMRSNLKNPDFRPYGEIMKYYITANNERYISTVCEITHFDGYFSKTQRYSHVWDISKGIILPYEYFLRKNGMTVKKVRSEIAGMIVDRIKNGGGEFSYTENSVKRYAFKCDPNNYFLTENGIAFWFPRGTLAPESEGFPTYVIKCDLL